MSVVFCFYFFFKQKTAYEVRISDWSSDVCSSDLAEPRSCRPRCRAAGALRSVPRGGILAERRQAAAFGLAGTRACRGRTGEEEGRRDRKSGEEGKGGSGRVALGGRRSTKKQKNIM